MNQSKIEGTPTNFKLISHVRHVPVIIPGILFVFTIVFSLIPVVILLNAGLRKGVILGSAIALYIAYLLLRMALWNLYGTEIIQYDEKQLSQQFDYRLFQSKPRTLKGEISKITLTELLVEPEFQRLKNDSEIIDSSPNQAAAEIVFHVDDNRTTTTLPFPIPEIERFFGIQLEHY